MKFGGCKAIVSEVNTFLDATFLDDICDKKPLCRYHSEPSFKKIWSDMNATGQKTYFMKDRMLYTDSQALWEMAPSDMASTTIQSFSESCSSVVSDASATDPNFAPSLCSGSSESGESDAIVAHGISECEQMLPPSTPGTTETFVKFPKWRSSRNTDTSTLQHKRPSKQKAIVSEVNTFLDVTFLDDICDEKPLCRYHSEPSFKKIWSDMHATGQKTYLMKDRMLYTDSQALWEMAPSDMAGTPIQLSSESCSSVVSDASASDTNFAPSLWSMSSESGESDAIVAHGTSECEQMLPPSTPGTPETSVNLPKLRSSRNTDTSTSHHKRPSKQNRQRYRSFVDNVMQQIMINPQHFDFALLDFPACVKDDTRSNLKIMFQECQARALADHEFNRIARPSAAIQFGDPGARASLPHS